MTKERLSILLDDMKQFNGSELRKYIEEKWQKKKDNCWNLPAYDAISISSRDREIGSLDGIGWVLNGIEKELEREDELLQKEEK